MRKILTLLVLLALCLPASAQIDKRYAYYIGAWNINNSNPRQAINTYNQLIAADAKAYNAYMYRGIAKINLSDYTGAESDLTTALELNPVYTDAYMYRAIARALMNKNSESIADYNLAIELRPDNAELFYRRGVTYFRDKDYDNTVQDLTRFLKHGNRIHEQPTEFGLTLQTEAYLIRGDSYFALGDTIKAYDDFSAAIKTNPSYPLGYYYRGTAYLNEKRYDEALADLKKSVEVDSSFIAGYFNLSILYNNTQKPMQAIDNLSRALSVDSTLSLAYFNRALVRMDIGDYNRALDDYNAVVRYSPDNVLGYYNRGLLYEDLGDYRAAIGDMTKAIELYPEFTNAYRDRARLKYLLNDMQGSKRDAMTAERKIAEYKSQVAKGILSPSEYADTSQRFNKLLSFDVRDIAMTSANSQLKNNVHSALAAMYRFDMVAADSVPRLDESYDGPLHDFMNKVANPLLQLSCKRVSLPVDSLMAMDGRLKEAIENGNWDGEVLFERGVVLSLLRQYSNAVNTLGLAIEKEPANPFLYLARSAVRTEMIEFIASLDTYGTSLAGDDAGGSGTTQYNYDEAIADLNKAARLYPEFAYTYYNRGRLQMLSGRADAAYADFSKAIALNPRLAEAYYNRGLLQISQGKTQEGRLDVSKAGELGMSEAYNVLKLYKD